ncbi:helix-turn-helix transcriptional regulator [Paenibacillus sp. 1P07SE]|uniref:helix-turn-helix transcriptional regulator n=1 Tax=Paenibacillus sp. 1P07SE TaxID=3132209 RepID=UPI0039A61EA4
MVNSRLGSHPDLHGRDRELQQLLQAWRRSLAGDSPCIVIRGEQGSGRSSLLHCLGRQVGGEGRFALCSAGSGEGPYEPLLHTLRMLLRGILAAEEPSYRSQRRKIKRSLGMGGRYLNGMLPELQIVLGEHAGSGRRYHLPAGMEARRLLEGAIFRLLKTLCILLAPIVLCFDDLHLADPAIGRIAAALAATDRPAGLLLLVVWEEDEEGAGTGMAMPWAKEWRGIVSRSESLFLRPLSADGVRDWVAAAEGLPVSAVEQLTAALHRRSGGNPGALRRLLQLFRQQGLLRNDGDRILWEDGREILQWLDRLDDEEVPAVERLARLGPETVELLAVLAVLGERAELSLLAAAAALSRDSVRRQLTDAVDQGLLEPYPAIGGGGEGWQFADQSLYLAAADRLPPASRAAVHRRAAVWLLQETGGVPRGERLDELLLQLNGCNEGELDYDRPALAELYRQAGVEAMRHGDYARALRYLKHAERLLHAIGRTGERDELALQRLALEYIAGSRGEADTLAGELAEAAPGARQLARIFVIQMEQHVYSDRRGEAIFRGLELLGRLGTVQQEAAAAILPEDIAMAAMALTGSVDLHREDAATQEETLLADVLMATASAAGFADYRLTGALVAEAIRRSEGGNAGKSAVEACAAAAGMLLWTDGSIDQARVLAETAIRLAGTQGDVRVAANVYGAVFPLYARLLPPSERGRFLRQAAQSTTATGLLHAGSVWSGMQAASYYLGGKLRALRRYLRWEEKRRQGELFEDDPYLAKVMELYGDFVQRLAHEAPEADLPYDQSVLQGGGQAMEDEPGAGGLPEQALLKAQYGAMHVQLCMLLGRPDEALSTAAVCRSALESAPFLPHALEYWLYTGLAAAAAGDAGWLAEAVRQTARWAAAAPANYGYKYMLLLGEQASMEGLEHQAGLYYEEAMKDSRAQRNYMTAALAGERAAALHLQAGRFMTAALLAQAAWQDYRRAGAQAAAGRVARYWSGRWRETGTAPSVQRQAAPVSAGTLLRRPASSAEHGASSAAAQTASARSGTIAAAGVLAAGSGNLRATSPPNPGAAHGDAGPLELTAALAGDAGAARALLLARSSQRLQSAVGWTRSGGAQAADSNGLPLSLLRLVERTGEELVLEEAASEGMLGTDPYIREHRIGALALLPVRDLGRVIGYLYLEDEAGGRDLAGALRDGWELAAAQTIRVWSAAQAACEEQDGSADPLTPREREVLVLLAQGWSNKELALRLGLAEGTVKIHLNRIYDKLGVKRRTQAVGRARQLGLL